MIRGPALLRSRRGRKTSFSDSLAAPTGGWNVRDPLASMSPHDALWLENWWPDTGDVALRKGCVYHVQDIDGRVESLMSYRSPTQTKLFAATPTKVLDVTSPNTTPTEMATITNGRFQHVQFTTTGGSFLVAVNGVNNLQLYDGTTWESIDAASTPAITGQVTTSLINVCVFKRRLWFVQRDTMTAWYLPVDSIGGALTSFPVGEIFSMGGHLVAMESWTIDGGQGPDDYLVFLTSEGEVAVYRGIDPSDDATFTLVGTAYIGKPIGPKSLMRIGGDVLIMAENGIFPLSLSYRSASINTKDSLSSKINKKLADVVRFYRNSFGWSISVFPSEQALLVNIPVAEGTSSQQFVMNTLTGAWTLFSGWDAFCWETSSNGVFFGGDGYVAQAFIGTDDLGLAIEARARTAFTYLRNRGSKHFKLFRPVLHATDEVNIDFGIDTDFNDVESVNFVQQGGDDIPGIPAPENPLELYWDSATWDSAVWGSDNAIRSYWWTAFGSTGFCVALRLRVSAKSVTLGWSSTDFMYQHGGGL